MIQGSVHKQVTQKDLSEEEGAASEGGGGRENTPIKRGVLVIPVKG